MLFEILKHPQLRQQTFSDSTILNNMVLYGTSLYYSIPWIADILINGLTLRISWKEQLIICLFNSYILCSDCVLGVGDIQTNKENQV